MILVAIGANLTSAYGSPRHACEAAVTELRQVGVTITAQSRWYESAPVPLSDQPWYVNGVVAVETALDPLALLDVLHQIEARMGRVRTARNAARVIDLDLIAYHEVVVNGDIIVPHPRMSERAFVVLPMLEIAPHWQHPGDKVMLSDLAAALPPDQMIRPLEK